MPIFVPHVELAKLLGSSSLRSRALRVGELLGEIEARVGPAAWSTARRAAILVNGRSIQHLQGLETPLEPEDEVWMVFPAAGG
jgi:molybdopterin synthase sulfur carrier subunit